MTTPTTLPTPIPGIHHVTAITADAQKNVDFYSQTLGLRLIKVTVNYDDPTSFHLYYGDGLGRPGTLMTHFVWPGANPGKLGHGQVAETAFAIPNGSAHYWKDRLTTLGISGVETVTRFGTPVVTFLDPDAMPLSLVETPDLSDSHFWPHGKIPAEHAIRGFHGVTLTQANPLAPVGVLTTRFGYTETAREQNRIRYTAPSNAAARTVDVLATPDIQRARMGAGQVHHVAFRTPTDAAQKIWLDTLLTDGHNVSPIMNRDYFRSIYFREPGGVLFEIATDGPGMTINETAEELGTHILLPAGVEKHRAEIEAVLPPITLAKRIEGVTAETPSPEPAASL